MLPYYGLAAPQPRLDFFEVELRTPTGQALPRIQLDGQTCFVGESGQEFQVAVTMANYSTKDYKVSVKVDGQDAGYGKIYRGLNPSFTGVFIGWLQQSGALSGACATAYRNFKLGSCKPSEGAATVDSAEGMSAGRIEVILAEVVSTGRQQAYLDVKAAAPSSTAAETKLVEGKKWFLAPGLKAEAGSFKSLNTTWDTTVYDTVAYLPSLKVRYDSSEALYLRKALNPRFAPHRAILRQSANPTIAALGAEPLTGAAGAAGNARGAAAAAAAAGGGAAGARVKPERAAGVKRERAVKRERRVDDHDADEDDDDFVVPRSATAAVDVDLTEEPVVPLSVNGRQLAPDELAVCDLRDSDDDGEGPKWEVRKKQVVEVEL